VAQLVRAEGIVLHSIRHGETSRIATVFTREHGKVGIIAKGARSKKGGVGAALEPLSRCAFLYYYKAAREIQMLKEVSLLDAHTGLRKALPLLTVASAMAELCRLTLKDADAHPEIYDLLDQALVALDKEPAQPLPILWKFELELLAALGFALSLERCAQCGKELKAPFSGRVGFRLEDGSFLGPDCEPGSQKDGTLAAETFAVLSSVARKPAAMLGRLTVSAAARREVQDFLANYLSYHLPVRGYLKSLAALEWDRQSA